MDPGEVAAATWRAESATIVGGLVRMVGDVGLAEELAQDALVAALEQWPATGVPDAPAAWLTTVARRRAVDHLRRSGRLEALPDDHLPGPVPDDRPAPAAEAADGPDDVLRLALLTCHPALAREERTAMTLRLVAGLSTAEIGRAFLLHEPQVVARIARAKRTLAGVGVEAPGGVAERLPSVLEVVYLVFNEGYTATSGDDLLRPALVDEALRLGRLLAAHAPDEPEVHGLVALMELQASRSAARTDATGAPVPIDAQDRSRWDHAAIRRGLAALLRARDGGRPGPYVLQAAIAVAHARAERPEDTDWRQIATLYDLLVALTPTAVVRLNRAVAVGRAHGPEAGLAAADELAAEGTLRDYHLLPAVRADLLARLDREAEARVEWRRAAALAANAAERAVLLRRADALAAVAATGPTLGPAVERFLGRDELAAASRRSYAQTLRRLTRALGDLRPLSSVDDAVVAEVVTTTWGGTSAATWNRHRAAVRSFAAWLGRPELAAALDGRPVLPREPRPAPTIPDGPARERALWTLLAESGATVTDVLALDVPDLGHLRCSPRTAELLTALVGNRTAGPVFLSDRRPAPARTPGARDLCPHTGRRRLSYERAEYLFKRASGGSTLGALRACARNVGS